MMKYIFILMRRNVDIKTGDIMLTLSLLCCFYYWFLCMGVWFSTEMTKSCFRFTKFFHYFSTDNYRNCRTVSESSTTSWGSDNPMEEDQGKLILEASPWLSSMFVRANDSDSDSSDSEWDQSENGQVVDFIRWQGDSLSPICSPTIPHVAGSISLDYDSDDSDDSDGILISCGNYHYDDEEEQRDHEEKRLFLEGINQRWNERMDQVGDETDAPAITNKQTKKVETLTKIQVIRL